MEHALWQEYFDDKNESLHHLLFDKTVLLAILNKFLDLSMAWLEWIPLKIDDSK